jgi:tetratricopeptide (TPR) repeat protein
MAHARRFAALAPALLLCVPLAARAGFRCPAKGGSEWREYRSKHFLVDTDLKPESAGKLIKTLEKMHALEMQALVGEQLELPGHLRVVALDDPGDYLELIGNPSVGGYFKVSSLDEPLIVLPVAGFEADPETIAHELAHYISWYLFPRQPLWFSEGLAAFVQTVASVPSENAPATGSHIVRGARAAPGSVGAMPRSMTWALGNARPIATEELLKWKGREDTAGSYHLASWLLYHWLWNNRSKPFADFQQRLGNGDDPAEAWRAALPEFDPSKPRALTQLDGELERYRKSARYAFYTVSADATSTFTQSALASADVHMLLLEARPGPFRAVAAERRADLLEALQEDPAQPQAIVERAALDHELPVAALRKAVAARPEDWRAWLLLGAALGGSEASEREPALRKAVALYPEAAWAHHLLAEELVTHGRGKEALPVANRAADLAPWSPAVIDTLAAVAVQLGKCKEAVALERRVAALVDPDSARAVDVAKRLADYQGRCGPPAAGEAPAAGQSSVAPR